MEELRTEFDKFIKEWQQKGYSYDTLYAWMKQRILDYDSSRVELPVMQKIAEVEHECKYCGCMTTQPDEQCYKYLPELVQEMKDYELKSPKAKIPIFDDKKYNFWIYYVYSFNKKMFRLLR